ncbi:hypothetical protein I3843_02G032300, partial [Carya illinoinensis]
AQNNPYSPTLKSSPLRLPEQMLRLPAPQNPKPNPPFQRRNPYPIKRVSPNQMQERREYHIGHKCSMPKLYLLEGMKFKEEEGEELEEEEACDKPNLVVLPVVQEAELLGISLHAIAGAPSPKTMTLDGKIGTCLVIVLIDTGSIHSFIDANVARRAKLPVEEGHLAV